jgi:molybdenum cofactor cytidylyltransferase
MVVVSRDLGFEAALAGMRLTTVLNDDPTQGISRSIRLGLDALPEPAEAALIGVADQPNLDAAAIRALRLAFRPGRIVAPRYDDHRGNPVIFDRRFFGELIVLEGDRGGQLIVEQHPEDVIDVSLPRAVGDDVDRPDEWRG